MFPRTKPCIACPARILPAWGTAYTLGPLAVHLWPKTGFFGLQLLIIAAIIVTIVESSRKAIVTSPSAQYFRSAWGILYGFGAIWFMILMPFGWWDDRHADFAMVP